MEEGRVLRPKGRSNAQNKSTPARTTATTTATTNTIPTLMSLAFPQIPVTSHQTTSPDTDCTITSPQYSSSIAQEIRQQFHTDRIVNPNQNVGNGNETVINNDGLTLREYVSASVGACQAAVLGQVKETLQQLVPQIVREVVRTERNCSFESLDATPSQPTQRRNHQEQFHNRPQDFANHQQQQQPFTWQSVHTYPRINTPLDLEKWGIKFDGSRKSFTVEDFVFRVESLQMDYNCPMSTLMKGFHHLLSGNAHEWFWTFRRENPYCEWVQLKYNLIRKFRRFESDSEIQRCIMERRQHPSESSEAFIGEIIALKNQLSRDIREQELVRIVKDNLKDGIYQLIYPININSFDHLLEECRRAERNIAKRSNRQYVNRRVNEIDFSDTVDNKTVEVEAVRLNATRQLICWNCKVSGHSFVDCSSEQRNLFCYKCGFEDVITPKCPRCSGNK